MATRAVRVSPQHVEAPNAIDLTFDAKNEKEEDVDERVVRRMLDPAHETKAEKIQAALALLGKRLIMDVEDAA